MGYKRIIGKIHLWLGLTSGLVVFLSVLPATIFVWDEELTDWWYKDYVFVKPQTSHLPLSSLYDIASEYFPDQEVLWFDLSADPSKSFVFQTYKLADNPGWTFFSELEYWNKIYINPYNGDVLGIVDMRYDWIYLCRMMHQQLLLNYEIGHWPVAIATLIMFVMLISGLMLWWPRNKNTIKQRFTIKLKARWRRKNYDLHNVGGFYISFFILILAITGLVWSFDWWENAIYRILGDNPTTVFYKEKYNVPPGTINEGAHGLDNVYKNLLKKKPDALLYSISIDKDNNNVLKEYSAWVTYDGKSLWDESDYCFFHPVTGELIHEVNHEGKTLGEKWRNSNYAIHVGSIWGYPTKILASIVALACAFLPVTGLLIWYGRNKKSFQVG